MITIGIRVQPGAITFVIYDSSSLRIVNNETLKIPKALSVPEQLKYVRSSVLDILREYNVSQAGIRTTESTAQTLHIGRLQIEGVIQEAFASSGLRKYYCGQVSSISSRVGIKRTDFKKFISAEINYEPVENWSKLTEPAREAALAAIGAVNA